MKTIIPLILFIGSILCAEAGTTVSGGGVTRIIPGSNVTVSPSNGVGVVTVSSSGGGGGSLTLDSSVTAVGFSYGSPTAGTLYLTNVNMAGGLARLTSSDGTADGSIAFLGTTDDGQYSVAVGISANSSNGGGAVGYGASTSSGGGAIGNSAYSDNGGAVGNNANSSNGGGAVGYSASTSSGGGGAVGYYASASTGGGAIGNSATESSGGGAVGNSAYSDSGGAVGISANSSNGGGAVGYGASTSSGGGAIGNSANATTGFAGGASTIETGGGANFCGGSYAGTGLAINGNEIANVNGQITSFYAIQRIPYAGGATAAFSITADSTHNILAFANGSTSSTTTAVTLPTGGFDGQTLDISYKTASTTITYAGASQIGGITAAVLGAKQRFIWDATLSEWR